MKKYVEIKIDVLHMEEKDIITFSPGLDNDFDDENWFNED